MTNKNSMEKKYQEMTKKEQAVIDTLQVLSFKYINSKSLTTKERQDLLSKILEQESRAVEMGLRDTISPLWVREKKIMGLY